MQGALLDTAGLEDSDDDGPLDPSPTAAAQARVALSSPKQDKLSLATVEQHASANDRRSAACNGLAGDAGFQSVVHDAAVGGGQTAGALNAEAPATSEASDEEDKSADKAPQDDVWSELLGSNLECCVSGIEHAFTIMSS
jgi:hypothetical protein